MKIARHLFLFFVCFGMSQWFTTTAVAKTNSASQDKLANIIASSHRTPSYGVRDAFRHPYETLKFFGLKDDLTVVEISPGGGWYTEILAPYLKENGVYIAAGYDPESKSEYFRNSARKFADKIKSSPTHYAKAVLGVMQPPTKIDFASDNSVDLILSFRNAHNWHSRGYSTQVFSAMYSALKPGGILGIVQHRAGDKHPADISGKLGYLREADVIALAQSAGFKLDSRSEINANPKDTKDHEKGVWSLPPVYRGDEGNREKYQAIGESDRMTLRFIKPAQ